VTRYVRTKKKVAVFNEILVGRFNRFMQKFLSMKGRASLRTLSDELFPVIPIFNGVENRVLESWNRFGLAFNLGANGAGNGSDFRFRNPAGSNVLSVIEKLSVNSTVAGTMQIVRQVTTVDLGTLAVVTASRQDARALPQPTTILSVTQTGAIATIAGQQTIVLVPMQPTIPIYDVILNENQEITVLPGDAIEVNPGGVNIGEVVSIMWRERFLEESERTG